MIATPKSSSRAYRLSNRLEIQQNSTQKSTAEKKCMERQPTVQLIQFHQQIIRDDKESQNHVKHLVDHSGSIDRHRCIDQQTNLEKYRTNSQPPYHRPPPPHPPAPQGSWTKSYQSGDNHLTRESHPEKKKKRFRMMQIKRTVRESPVMRMTLTFNGVLINESTWNRM